MTERANRPPWQIAMIDIHTSTFADTVETVFRVAVEPSCKAIAGELAACVLDGNDTEWDRRDDLRRTQLDLHRSFALMLGGLWERNFQQLLLHSVHLTAESDRAGVTEKIMSGELKKISEAFQKIRGFNLDSFDMYSQLELLCLVTSAVRHGDGRSAKKVQDIEPSMFLKDVEPMNWLTYFTYGGIGDASVIKLEVTFDRLVEFKDAVVRFWREIDKIRMAGI